MNHKTKCGKVKPLEKITTGKTSNTKNAISFPYEIRFWWSLARWNHDNELIKIIHRNIIVQQWIIKPNVERLTLFIKDISVNLQYQKRNRFSIRNPFLINLSLYWRSWQALKPHMEEGQIRTKKDDAKYAKVWALSEWYDQVTHSRAPLESVASIL